MTIQARWGLWLLVLLLAGAFLVAQGSDLQAAPRGGGKPIFSASGPASGGGFGGRLRGGQWGQAGSTRNQGQRQKIGGANQGTPQATATTNQANRQATVSTTTTTNQANRQNTVSNNQQNRQDTVTNNQENRQDWVNNTYVYGGGYVVGAPVAATAVVVGTAAAAGAATATTTPTAAPVQAVGVLPCAAPPVNVGKVSYFRCGSTWYTPAYVSGNLAYLVTAAPPGY